jgi:hypothetical protein
LERKKERKKKTSNFQDYGPSFLDEWEEIVADPK